MTTLKQSLMAIAATAALALSASAGATSVTNLVTNGGFETGDFSGWTQFGNLHSTGVGGGGNALTGSYGGYFGPTLVTGGAGGIYQALSTTAGSTYAVDFWLANDSGTPNSFSVSWGGVTQGALSLTDVGYFPYTHYSFLAAASAPTTQLKFTFLQVPKWFHLDNVNVSVHANVAPVPLPAAIWLFGSALTGLAGISYKRKQPKA